MNINNHPLIDSFTLTRQPSSLVLSKNKLNLPVKNALNSIENFYSLSKSFVSHLPKIQSRLNALNKSLNSRYEGIKVSERLILKFKDPEKILQVIDKIIQENKHFNGQNPHFALDKTKIDEIKNQLKTSSVHTREKTDKHIQQLSLSNKDVNIKK